MAHGLEEWLAYAWGECTGTRTPATFQTIYRIYETLVDPNERGFALGTNGLPTDFPDVYAPLSAQHQDDPLALGGTDTGAGYLYFFSPTHADGGSRHRIVVHASPYNTLIRLMRAVVREMNSPGGALRNANGAKVMTRACYASGRNDTLIIYTRDRRTADRALVTLGTWIAEGLFSTRDFDALLPMTIRKVYPGIGYACEPPQTQIIVSYPQALSYGKFLSQLIYIACAIALAAEVKNEKKFIFLATYVLQLAGVQAPDEPYEFGAMSPTFVECLPWNDQVAWSAQRKAEIKQTKLYKLVTERTEIAFSYFG